MLIDQGVLQARGMRDGCTGIQARGGRALGGLAWLIVQRFVSFFNSKLYSLDERRGAKGTEPLRGVFDIVLPLTIRILDTTAWLSIPLQET